MAKPTEEQEKDTPEERNIMPPTRWLLRLVEFDEEPDGEVQSIIPKKKQH